jgi:hypothetical protein
LFGMIDARKLVSVLQEPGRRDGFDYLAQLLNDSGGEALADLPGFVPATAAVHDDTDKRVALQKMEELGADWLPVVEPDGRFNGVVERSRLTASLILDVAQRLEAAR